MRTIGLVAIAITGLGMSGCSQVSSIFKKKPDHQTTDGSFSDASLRSTPQQPYQFADQTYDVEIYDSAAQYSAYSQYAGYQVDLYNSPTSYIGSASADPRQAEFVMLNGKSNIADWQNCETRHKGYLFMSEYNFSLNPGFEVCMRNKGYVLSSEYGPSSKQKLSAQTARLRGSIQSSHSATSSHSVSGYPGYYR